ncbi:uncharacterized protein LOC114247824 isoform X1 [Bombyx mandarina]|uniref:Uncharacterized protein LOC114247824 isoform X1 n=1 Tax=Bombyx mandarina TaxID=7092 RepID=A0A6J2K6U5_BOMMA|nr:uncharacterized protein LOC114247824 isoform X1 [Bombyx mandarina]XP_028036691.1 uncharacterized protein LOC114247824 isoform X1 [Bombyx mandarina]
MKADINCEDLSTKNNDVLDSSNNLELLYCSHLWKDSILRQNIINAPSNASVIKYCYTCKGKVRKYEINPVCESFIPTTYSTPNTTCTETTENEDVDSAQCIEKEIRGSRRIETVNNERNMRESELNENIPSISQHVDSDFRNKYTSYELPTNENSRRGNTKIREGMCWVLKINKSDSLFKKRTQLQACSISVMIVAIVVISIVLINFATPNLTHASNVVSKIVVPTSTIYFNDTSIETSTVNLNNASSSNAIAMNFTNYVITTEHSSIENISIVSSIISKIRNNLKTFSKEETKNKQILKPKDIINRDISKKFCSCQSNEICMLDENSGKSVCRIPIDRDDPTGCGGLCTMELEACHLVDKELGVRVCRLLTLATCSPEEWRCRNGLCVPTESRCNGSVECYDRSDEVHCDCDLTKQFRCGNLMSCFSNMKLCDGIVDCWDGFDERNCTECPQNQSPCKDGQCFLSSRFCDGFVDCEDRSDEPDGCGGSCRKHELRCLNQRCVPLTVKCDGQDNCGDASDELNCFMT